MCQLTRLRMRIALAVLPVGWRLLFTTHARSSIVTPVLLAVSGDYADCQR